MAEIAVVLSLAAAASHLLFERLGESSFHDGDEALYATVAREMVEHHSFLTPTYWGTPFLHKPPLPYWLMAASAATIPGSRELGARFPSALATLVLLGLVYASTRRLAGVVAAAFATCVLALNHQVLFEHAARSASFDALLSLLMFGALVAGLKAADGPRWRFAAIVLLGSVALVKAPMVIFPSVAIVLHFWMRERRFPLALVLRGAAGVAIVALPWHLYQLIAHGSEFWNTYVVYEILGRAGETTRDTGASPIMPFNATGWSFLPWSPLIVVALVASVAGWPRRPKQPHDDIVRSLGIYAASILVFFCFIPSKWPWYSIPAYPALAVVAAVFLRRWYDSPARRFLPLVLAALACACVFLLRTNHEYDPTARASYRWPAEEPFYLLGAGNATPVATVAVIVTLAAAIACLLPLRKTMRMLELAAITAALLIAFQFNYRSVRSVPQTHTSGVSRLAREVESSGIERVYMLGFSHQDRYGRRPEPFSSYYLLGIRNAQVTDCGTDLACIASFNDAQAALVVSGPALSEAQLQDAAARASALAPRLQTWVIQSPQRYEKLQPLGAAP